MNDPPETAAAYREAHPHPNAPGWNPRAVRALALAVGSVGLLPAGVTVATLALPRLNAGGVVVTWTLLAVSLATLGLAVASARRAVRVLREVPTQPVPERGRWLAGIAFPLSVVGLLFGLLGFLLTWLSTVQFSRGRQLRRRGRVLLAPVAPGARWTTAALSLSVDPAHRDAVAAQWRENGRTEHASVASFARLSLDLAALGAPASLLAAAHRDALDEVRHAELCFSLARAIDGRALSPGDFPAATEVPARSSSRRLALARLAVDSLLDGALHEGVSARVVARLARRCDEPAVRAVLREIAADEGRHAAHGWDVVMWCLDEGGPLIAQSLLGAVEAIPPAVRSPRPEEAASGAWERWGIHGHALEADAYSRAVTDLRDRVGRICAAVGTTRATAPAPGRTPRRARPRRRGPTAPRAHG
jgi:hypothetical protein